jgi:hypothetical protein
MIHVVVLKRLTGLPLLIHIELLWRSRKFCAPNAQPWSYHVLSVGGGGEHGLRMFVHSNANDKPSNCVLFLQQKTRNRLRAENFKLSSETWMTLSRGKKGSYWKCWLGVVWFKIWFYRSNGFGEKDEQTDKIALRIRNLHKLPVPGRRWMQTERTYQRKHTERGPSIKKCINANIMNAERLKGQLEQVIIWAAM